MAQIIIAKYDYQTNEFQYWCDFRPEANRMYFSWYLKEAKKYANRQEAKHDLQIAMQDKTEHDRVFCTEVA